MGAANCCKKPDEIVIEELKNSTNDNNKYTSNDQDSYPQDTEQYRANANLEDENGQIQAVSNQNLYEQEVGTTKIGGAYEVPINISSPQNYEEGYESNNMGLIQQYDNQNINAPNLEERNLNQYEQDNQIGYNYFEGENINTNINSKIRAEANIYEGNQEDQGIDYDALVNQMGNEASLKALRMGNAGGINEASASNSYGGIQRSKQEILNNYNIQQNNIENTGGLDLNNLTSDQQGGINLNNLTIGEQQGGIKTIVQTSKKVEYNKIGNGTQQTTTTTTTTIKKKDEPQQNPEEISSKAKTQVLPNKINIKQQLAMNINPPATEGLDLNKLLQQEAKTTQKSSVASVTPVITNDDINKYFKQNVPANQVISSTTSSEEPKDKIISKDNEPETLKQIKITKIEIDPNEELPETFGSYNINNFKQTTTTTITKTTGNANEAKIMKQTITTTTSTKKEGNTEQNDLTKAKYSEDVKNLKEETTTTTTKDNINNFNQTTTVTTKKEGGDLNKKELTQEVKQVTTTATKEGIIDSQDLPEVFGSFDINKFKETTKTTTKEGKEVDLKNLPKDIDVNSLKQITTTTTKEGIIDMKDLPEVFGSFDINNFKQTTTTTTTEGKIDNKNMPQSGNFKQTTITTTTKTTGNAPIDLKDFGLEKNISLNPATNSTNFKQTTVTTTTKTTGNTPTIDLKQFRIEQNPSTNPITGVEDYSKYFQEFSQTTSSPIDLKQFGLEQNPSAMSNLPATTKTTKTTKITTTSNNGNIDLKQFGIEQNPSTGPITGTEDYNKYFKESSQATSAPIDLKEFGLEQNPSALSNLQQTTTTTKTTGNMTGFDLKQFGIEQNPSTGPITGTEDYSKYFKTTQITGSGIPTTQTSSAYGANKTTTTKVTKTTYVAPTTQSYSYNYSYNMPNTSSNSTKVTKTTYSQMPAGTAF